jgi:hypothetical protein
MVSPFWLIVSFSTLVAIACFGVIALNIKISPLQMWFIVGMVFVSLVGGVVLKFVLTMKPKIIFNKDLDKAEELAKGYWRARRHEEIETVDGLGGERLFGKEKFFGFLFHRYPVGPNAGLPLVLIVGQNPWRVSWKSEYPGTEEQENPFHKFATVFKGAPSSTINPETEPAFFMRRSRPPTILQKFGTSPTSSAQSEDEKFYGKKKEEET